MLLVMFQIVTDVLLFGSSDKANADAKPSITINAHYHWQVITQRSISPFRCLLIYLAAGYQWLGLKMKSSNVKWRPSNDFSYKVKAYHHQLTRSVNFIHLGNS